MWKKVSYEVCGRSHIKSNTPCQDKTYIYENKEEGISVIALADGAGSAKYSHYGAEVSTKVAAEYIAENFDSLIRNEDGVQVKEKIVQVVKDELYVKAEELSCDLKDLASTLLVVVIKKGEFIVLHLGDGIIGYMKNDELRVVTSPNNGEFANVTVFTTSGSAAAEMKLFKGAVNGISGFVLMSDGTGDSFYHKRTKTLSQGAARIINWTALLSTEKMHKLLSESFNEIIVNNTHDDCSIAVIAASNKAGQVYSDMADEEKVDVLNICAKTSREMKKRLKKFDIIFESVDKPISLSDISKKIHVKKRYTKITLNKLVKEGILEYKNGCYSLTK